MPPQYDNNSYWLPIFEYGYRPARSSTFPLSSHVSKWVRYIHKTSTTAVHHQEYFSKKKRHLSPPETSGGRNDLRVLSTLIFKSPSRLFQCTGNRYSTLGDLCYHMGDQSPLPIVKLIARDIIRGLTYLHEICDIAHNGERLYKELARLENPTVMRIQISSQRQSLYHRHTWRCWSQNFEEMTGRGVHRDCRPAVIS